MHPTTWTAPNACPMDVEALLLVHAASTWAMVGLIWFVQIAHYPLFAAVGRADFPRYQVSNVRATSLVVGPLLAAEGASTLGLLALLGGPLTWVGAGLLLLIWLSTALLQVPCHARLERGFDAATADRLVRTNWIRTIGWTARGCCALGLLVAHSPT
jgi:hypothetical protein